MAPLIRLVGILLLFLAITITWSVSPEWTEFTRVTAIWTGALIGIAGCIVLGWAILLEDNE